MQKYHPILYSTAMVCAILEGRKTQTRRIIKRQPTDSWMENTRQFSPDGNMYDRKGRKLFWIADNTEFGEVKCPYGAPGDILWVREKWKHAQWPIGWPYHFYAANEEYTHPDNEKWKPGIHMPKQATRLWTRVEGVKVERLQDISADDAIAEGIEQMYTSGMTDSGILYRDYRYKDKWVDDPVVSYRSLWERINGWGSWDTNPWIWAITNQRHDVPQEDWQAFRADFLKGGKHE